MTTYSANSYLTTGLTTNTRFLRLSISYNPLTLNTVVTHIIPSKKAVFFTANSYSGGGDGSGIISDEFPTMYSHL